jgi:hypothetical protein
MAEIIGTPCPFSALFEKIKFWEYVFPFLSSGNKN